MNDTPVPVSTKSRLSYILLGFFFGSLGIHNFYAGYTDRGIIQLLITVLSCGTLSLVSEIWSIIEICTVNQDSEGLRMIN